jgi:hypothetical protein
LAASFAIEQVANSIGIIVPIVNQEERDSAVHNIRAAFIAGLAEGMKKLLLIIEHINGPIFLDTRDLTKYYNVNNDIDELINDFAAIIHEARNEEKRVQTSDQCLLADLSIGDPMAENELTTLGRYYLKTDQFTRTARGEVNVVVGSKGTGKTALFAQLRDRLRDNRNNIVVDLKPEGYQLIKLREEIFDYLSEGAKTHLIVAFLEYLLYLEIAYKILDKDGERHLRDQRLFGLYRELKEKYTTLSPTGSGGDFSERLQVLSELVVERYRSRHDTNKERLTSPDITSLLRTNELRGLRETVSEYLAFKDAVWILFDNLDKGWTSSGIANVDITILRCLIDASRKIQREMQRDSHEFHAVVFVRNDIYQYLMRASPDFGKEMVASLDWNDRDLLREVLRLRLIQKDQRKNKKFDEVWQNVCTPIVLGQESSDYVLDRCMMRPRNLLKLFTYARGIAVNLRHNKIESEDLEKGFEAYSNDILADADNEMRDMYPKAAGFLYSFIFEKSEYRRSELKTFLKEHGIEPADHSKIIEYLLYYGFFGVKFAAAEEPTYIFDLDYDMRKFAAIMSKYPSHTLVIHQALRPALRIRW